MNYNDYRTYILTCEYLGKEPAGQYKRIYDFLTERWDGIEVVVDSRFNRIVLQKGGEWFMYQDMKNGHLWCQYEHVWSFFQNIMGMEIPEIQDFVKSTVEEHLKCKVGTPGEVEAALLLPVEEHLKCKVGTPRRTLVSKLTLVEEHLKCKVGTPGQRRVIPLSLVEEHLKCKVGTPEKP